VFLWVLVVERLGDCFRAGVGVVHGRVGWESRTADGSDQGRGRANGTVTPGRRLVDEGGLQTRAGRSLL